MTLVNTAPSDAFPLVIVAIPAYNAGTYIGDTIQSVINQTYPHWRLVVYENGSTDNTRAVVRAFSDERITLCADDNYVSMEEGFARCTKNLTGDFLQILCADDLMHPTCLEIKVHTAQAVENADCALISSNRMLIAPDNRDLFAIGYAKQRCRASLHDVLSEVVRRGSNPIGDWSCVLFRTSVISQQPPSFTGRLVIDIRYYLALLQRGDLLHLPETLSSFRLSGVSGRELSVHWAEYLQFYRGVVSPYFSGYRRLYYYCGYAFFAARFILRHILYVLVRKQVKHLA